MRILSDHDVIGLVDALLSRCRTPEWTDIWSFLEVEFLPLRDVGLNRESSDADIWHACQANEAILITGNRNADGEDSLGETLAERNDASCLPVITLSNLERLRKDSLFVEQAADSLMDYLIDIENLRGTGRLYIP